MIELAPLVLATNLATDPDIPANTLTYALITSPPGMLINENSGVIVWTPSEAQGPSTNSVSVRITDQGVPSFDVTNTFALVVDEVNTMPSLSPLANCTHVVGAMCWITNSASDSDWPAQALTYSLVNAPPGMSIGPTTGLVLWGPPATTAPLTNTVTVRVTDDGAPALTNEQTFVATLISPPRLRIEPAGTGLVVLSWPAAATAAGFVLHSTTNLFAAAGWEDVAGIPVVLAGENRLTNAAASTFRAYRLVSPLAPLPTLRIAATSTNTAIVTWPTNAVAFVLQVSSTIQWPTWGDATNSVATIGNLNFITDPIATGHRYYRLRFGPH